MGKDQIDILIRLDEISINEEEGSPDPDRLENGSGAVINIENCQTADRILPVALGRMAMEGTHDELIAPDRIVASGRSPERERVREKKVNCGLTSSAAPLINKNHYYL